MARGTVHGESLLIDALCSEVRIAHLSGETLQSLDIERPGDDIRAGDIVLARVKVVTPGIGGAFLDIGDVRDAFLPFSDKAKRPPVQEGARVVVQVRHVAVAEKGARLSLRPNLRGRYCVYLPGQPGINVPKTLREHAARDAIKGAAAAAVADGDGVVLRSATFAAPDGGGLLSAEIERLRTCWADVSARAEAGTPPQRLLAAPGALESALLDADAARIERIVIDGGAVYGTIRTMIAERAPELGACLSRHSAPQALFEAEGVEEQIDAALGPYVALPMGGRLWIVETPACVSVDVDSGEASGRGSRAQVIERTNLEAAEALVREMRLRNLSGNVVVDFISSPDRKQGAALLERLEALCGDDDVPVQVLGFTRAGFVELVRARRGAGLGAMLRGDEARVAETVAYAVLRALHGAARACPGKPLGVRAHARVIALLQGTLAAELARAGELLGVALTLQASDSGQRDAFEIFS